MDKINKDSWGVILSYCGLGDWQNSRLVCKKWRECADRIDVVRAVYAQAGGYSAKRLSAEEYKELILERLAVEQIMLPKFEAVRAVPFSVPEELAVELNDLRHRLHSISLEQAGLPDHVATLHFGDRLSSRMLIWNCLTLSLERILNLSKNPVRMWTVFCSEDGDPRLAVVAEGGKIHRIELWNPLTGERLRKSESWETRFPSFVRSKLISGKFLQRPRLLIYDLRRHLGVVYYILRFFDAATLETLETYEYAQKVGRLANVDGRVRLVHDGNVCLLDVETGELEERLEVEADRSTWTIQIQERTHFVSRQGCHLSWVGSPQKLEVDPHFHVDVQGVHWGVHDYLLLSVNDLFGTVHLWRDDGQMQTTRFDRIKQLLPRKPWWQVIPDGRSYRADEFVPVGRGLVWTGDNISRPIGLFPLKRQADASESQGYTRLFLIGGLATLALGILAYQWLRPRPLEGLARTGLGRTVRG